MVSVEGDYSVCVTQAPAFIKVLYGVSLTSEEKDGLRHTVFYTAQFRADLHSSSRSMHHGAPTPCTPTSRTAADTAAADDVSSSSSDGEEIPSKAFDSHPGNDSVEEDDTGCNVPRSATKDTDASGRGRELQGDDTPSSVD